MLGPMKTVFFFSPQILFFHFNSLQICCFFFFRQCCHERISAAFSLLLTYLQVSNQHHVVAATRHHRLMRPSHSETARLCIFGGKQVLPTLQASRAAASTRSKRLGGWQQRWRSDAGGRTRWPPPGSISPPQINVPLCHPKTEF